LTPDGAARCRSECRGLISRSVALTPDGETAAYTYAHMISELFVARGLA